MPIYEYRCLKCRKTFETFQKITDAPLKKCQDCGGEIKRLISRTSFSLKGSGWYKNGYSPSKKEQKETVKKAGDKKEEKKKEKKNGD